MLNCFFLEQAAENSGLASEDRTGRIPNTKRFQYQSSPSCSGASSCGRSHFHWILGYPRVVNFYLIFSVHFILIWARLHSLMHQSAAAQPISSIPYLHFIVFTVKTGKIISYNVIILEFIYGDLDNIQVIVGGLVIYVRYMQTEF